MKQGSIEQAYNNVYKFNAIAANITNVTLGSIDNQISYIFEELVEAIDAIEANDATELLDGACDLFVTVAGLMQKLEAVGFDVDEALRRVNENNLSKYVPKGKPIRYPAGIVSVYNAEYEVSVLKNMDGKIVKPIGFVPVDLTGLAPEGFFEGAA